MSLSAEIAEMIVRLDVALERFDDVLGPIVGAYQVYADLRLAIEGMQEASLGEGMHYETLEEARVVGRHQLRA